jgi:hypothetical protein
MPKKDTIAEIRELLERRLAGLAEERKRLERALAHLGGNADQPARRRRQRKRSGKAAKASRRAKKTPSA